MRRAEAAGVGGDVFYQAMQQKPIFELVSQFRDGGMTLSVLEVDLADETNISKLFDTCEEELGPVDILINNHTHCVLKHLIQSRLQQKEVVFSYQLLQTLMLILLLIPEHTR